MKWLFLLMTLATGTSNGDDWQPLTKMLEETEQADVHRFGLRDNERRPMDCLEVFQPKGSQEIYGIYHTLKDRVFSVHLATSKNLKNWTHVAALDSNASQAAMHETADGKFLMAYEKDAPNSCWIRIRLYENLDALRAAKTSQEFDIPRTLAPTAEGTPSFESVKIGKDDLSDSEIKLRFHFYQNARVDQLASGTLTNFKDWNATPSPKLNSAFKKLGGLGNLGDRDGFIWEGQNYYVQEIQGAPGVWSSWGIYLCDALGNPLKKLAIETPKNSTAFSNPAVSWVTDQEGEKKLVFTAYLHSRGTSPEEIGQMISVITHSSPEKTSPVK